MRRRRRLPAVALAIAALATPVAVADTAVASAGRPPAIAWRSCPEDPTAQCGTLRVPVDWSRPRGPKIDVAVARRPATDPSARIGSLQVNPGGPGGSGRDFAIAGAGTFSPEIRRRFDIVGMDPRGVGASTPVLCSAELVAQVPSLFMASQADFEARLAFNARLRADCRARTGPLFDHVDMLSVVRDMDALRAALGDAKLTYYGLSYGTLNAQLYAELFPHRVRAIVSDSNLDHSLGTRGFLDTEAASAQDSFDEFVKWSDRTPGSALHGRDVRAVWHRLLERAGRGEIPYPPDPTVPLRPEDLITRVFVAFYSPDWYGLARLLSDLDSGAPVAGGAAPAARSEPQVVPFPPLAIFCADWRLPIRDHREFAGHVDRLARIAPEMRYGPPALSFAVGCLGTPAPIANPQRPARVRGLDTPLLLLNARHDPATGYERALGAARQLGREGVLLTYDGWGHGAYPRGDCVAGAVDRYLLTRRLPARGTHCPGIEPAPPPAARSLTTWPAAPAFPY
ncbi:alpha/beta hydrolase [Phytohabitans kaempferiae]|uniref:Alpha/beta hydrolase n=1 Tax=Phytohabitans kaempferiae TaxID=1620943 RepID=A0ABV6M2M9_9ACTN